MDKFKEITDTKQLRKDIDEIIQHIKALDKCRETSIVITKLQESVMWLGMNLKRLGNDNPYPESYNPKSTKIEPTADGLKFKIMENKVFNAVMLSTNALNINKENLFIVWSCYILGNRKFLVGCKNNTCYYEVTYNANKDEWYVDEYFKNSNRCITNDTLEDYSKINS